MVCSICKGYSHPHLMIKWSVRRYAHGACIMREWPNERILELPPAQLGMLPALSLNKRRLMGQVQARMGITPRPGTEFITTLLALRRAEFYLADVPADVIWGRHLQDEQWLEWNVQRWGYAV